mgnify:CR=1 FL=1|jgi:hypothetical protein
MIVTKNNITWINLSDGKGSFAGIPVDYGINGWGIGQMFIMKN